jgi:hypothetical protein
MTMLTGAAGDGLLDKDRTDGGAQPDGLGCNSATAAGARDYERFPEDRRSEALGYSMELAKMGWGSAPDSVVANAKVLEAYLAGTDTETTAD